MQLVKVVAILSLAMGIIIVIIVQLMIVTPLPPLQERRWRR